MAVSVSVPNLGNHMRAGLVAEWYQPDGAIVHSGDPVCRLECDFVAVDLEAEATGVLRHRLDAGLIRPPGDLLGVILAQGERLPAFEPVDIEAFLPERAPETPPADALAPAAAIPTAWEVPFVQPAEREFKPESQPRREPFVLAPPVAEDTTLDAPPAWPAADEATGNPAPADPLPFLRRPRFELQPPPTELWEPVPGDAVEFASGLLPVPADAIPEPAAEPHPVGFAGDEAENIDLAGWLKSEPENPAPVLSAPVPRARETDWTSWDASRDAPTPAVPPVVAAAALTMSVTVALTEAHKMCKQLAHEWRAAAILPSNTDIAFRAVARALCGLPGAAHEAPVALRTLNDGEDFTSVLVNAAHRPFRDAVVTLASGGDGIAPFAVLTSCATDGIEAATPRLDPGYSLALALGAERQAPAWNGEHWIPAPVATLTIAYDPAVIADADAARFLARVRDLVESPYALLADQ